MTVDFETISPLDRIVYLRDGVEKLCRGIDTGQITPSEPQMLALGLAISRHGGPLAHDLLCQIASRCRNGRKVLDQMDRRGSHPNGPEGQP